MGCQLVEIDLERPAPRRIAAAVRALEEGHLVAYPTDVNYGIGCDLLSRKALSRLSELKARDPKKPMTFLCPDLSVAAKYARIDDQNFRLMRRLTPGPYTFILEASREVPKVVTTKQKSVGVRLVESPVVQALLEGLGRPILNTTAATDEGELLGDPRSLRDTYGHGLEMILDCGLNLFDSTTVVDLRESPPQLLRVGLGDPDAL